MLDDRDINHEIGNVVAGLVGLLLLVCMVRRLSGWWMGAGSYKTFLGAVAGRPIVRGRWSWDCGFWELCPDGQLAGIAMIVLVGALLGGAILNRRSLYGVVACVIAAGYLVNAFLLLKLMAAY